MKLASLVSLAVSIFLFTQVWADNSEQQPAAETASKSTDSTVATATKSAAGVKWQTDLKAAHQLSVALNRPMLIVFGADWCSYCRKMERTTLAEADVIKQINAKFVPVHLDLDDNGHTAEILEVKRIPCTVALSPRADLLGRLTGYVSRKQYGESLNRVLDLHRKVDQQLAVSQ
ncbi:MAG: thioredoxin family protein [Planctomycetota bacterium]|jgi:thioredoxin-related protein